MPARHGCKRQSRRSRRWNRAQRWRSIAALSPLRVPGGRSAPAVPAGSGVGGPDPHGSVRADPDAGREPGRSRNACLAGVDVFNPKFNAFISALRERALAEARALEAEQRAGRSRGPLHGIPIALKDNMDTAGICTIAVSVVFATRVRVCVFVRSKVRSSMRSPFDSVQPTSTTGRCLGTGKAISSKAHVGPT